MIKSGLKLMATVVTKVPIKTIAITSSIVGGAAGIVGASDVESAARTISKTANTIDICLYESGIINQSLI